MVVLEPWSFYCSAFIVPIANGPLVFCSIRLLELVGWLRAYAGVPYVCFLYHPPTIAYNFSQPPEGVRSRFKVLAHSTGYGECAKPIRNVVRRLLGGEKLHAVELHLYYPASRRNDTLAFC